MITDTIVEAMQWLMSAAKQKLTIKNMYETGVLDGINLLQNMLIELDVDEFEDMTDEERQDWMMQFVEEH